MAVSASSKGGLLLRIDPAETESLVSEPYVQRVVMRGREMDGWLRIDGTGPTYTGNFWDPDSDNVRAVRHGDVLVQKDTDLMRSIAHRSDGSRAFVMTHAQLTINANGETTVEFEIDKMVCS
jgi:hypothetical protein